MNKRQRNKRFHTIANRFSDVIVANDWEYTDLVILEEYVKIFKDKKYKPYKDFKKKHLQKEILNDIKRKERRFIRIR